MAEGRRGSVAQVPPEFGRSTVVNAGPVSSDPLRRMAPMKAVVDVLPRDDGTWSTELKWDGMRLMMHMADGELIMRSASGRDTTKAFPELLQLADHLPDGTVLDGEAIVMVDGEPSFRALQHRIHVDRPSSKHLSEYPVKFVVFDVLWFGGHDITSLPFSRRRDALEQTVDTGPSWLVSILSQGAPQDLFDVAAARGLEGVVCKRLDSPYVQGRSAHWRKIKVRPRTDMVIGGWSLGSGALSKTIGSLVVGIAHPDGYLCAGSVGSGLTDADRKFLRSRFIERESSPFFNSEVVTGPDPVVWVEPEIVAEIGFARWDEGMPLWQPTFHGIRADGDPSGTQYRL